VLMVYSNFYLAINLRKSCRATIPACEGTPVRRMLRLGERVGYFGLGGEADVSGAEQYMYQREHD
jgi:hypothetical protein